MIKAFQEMKRNLVRKLGKSFDMKNSEHNSNFSGFTSSKKFDITDMERKDKNRLESAKNLKRYLNFISVKSCLSDKNKHILGSLSFISDRTIKGYNNQIKN
jgi:hypothetical protein